LGSLLALASPIRRRADLQLKGVECPQLDNQYSVFQRSWFCIAPIVLYASFGPSYKNAIAQDGLPTTEAAEQTAPTSTPNSSVSTDPSPQTNERAETQEETNKNKKESRGAIVVAPIPISSPAVGSGVVLVGGYIFPFRMADKVSPPSTIGAAGLFTDSGSRGLAVEESFTSSRIRITSRRSTFAAT
jgi:hypothetical protein